MPNLDALKIEKVQLMSKLEEIEAASASRKQNIDELNTLLNNYNKLLAPDIMIEQHKNESNKTNDLGL